MGATDIIGRIATSIHRQEAPLPAFQPCHDLQGGGVLLALPVLLAVGLLHHADRYFQLPSGYYRVDTIFLLLAFMALARLKTAEDLRMYPPGEWGKLLGIDRIPEVKTLREKVGLLVDCRPGQWAAELCRDWMAAEPEAAGVLYIDGHVRIYHGKQTELPRHYVSRQQLCLRATADYWVNAMDGRPFFVINKAVAPGLLQVLEEEIVPRLEDDVPDQPTPVELAADPGRHRFTLVFDREGYSPAFMKRMWKRRIACLTYKKFPGEDWPVEEFAPRSVKLQAGNVVEMQLAERGVFLGDKLWVREIRKLTTRGHQTAIIATDYRQDCPGIAMAMFARWSQENFPRYMRQHFNLDRLIDYSTKEISETTRVVNPQYREIDGEVRKTVMRLNRQQKEFGAFTLDDEISPGRVADYQQKKAEMLEGINHLQAEVAELKACRKETPKHVKLADLPPEDQFRRLGVQSKYFIDTIKMIAYRAETAMAAIAREKMSKPQEARSLLRGVYNAAADIIPDQAAGTLTVRVHSLANRSSDLVTQYLCEEMKRHRHYLP
jgi:hypothetical protein